MTGNTRRWLVAGALVAVALMLLAFNVSCSPMSRYDAPRPRVARPTGDVNWSQQAAYGILRACDNMDRARGHDGWPSTVSTEAASATVKLGAGEPFAFQWASHAMGTPSRSFTLLEDGTATVTDVGRYLGTFEGQPCYMPESVTATFQLTPAEIDIVREAIRESRLGSAPDSFILDNVADGLQWIIRLRANGATRRVYFSNAMPGVFRNLLITIWQDACAPHADEIARFQRVKDVSAEVPAFDQ